MDIQDCNTGLIWWSCWKYSHLCKDILSEYLCITQRNFQDFCKISLLYPNWSDPWCPQVPQEQSEDRCTHVFGHLSLCILDAVNLLLKSLQILTNRNTQYHTFRTSEETSPLPRSTIVCPLSSQCPVSEQDLILSLHRNLTIFLREQNMQLWVIDVGWEVILWEIYVSISVIIINYHPMHLLPYSVLCQSQCTNHKLGANCKVSMHSNMKLISNILAASQ